MTTPSPSEAQVLERAVADLANRSFHTFWQSAVASASVLWAGSGLNAHELVHISGLEKFAVTVVGGAGAAGLSAVKTLVKTYVASKKALV